MSKKSSNKSSPFVQLSLDMFSTESPFPIASQTGWRNALNGRSEETGSGLGASLDRFIDSHGVTFICIGTGSGFRRYISSDGYPWTLRLKPLRLERGTIVSHNSPAEIFHNGAKRQPYCRMNFRSHHHLVHRIVAQFFLNGGKPIPPGMQVDHLDGNRQNNAVSNLEIVTREENQRRCNLKHGWKHLSAHQRKLASETRKRRFARYHAARQSAAPERPPVEAGGAASA